MPGVSGRWRAAGGAIRLNPLDPGPDGEPTGPEATGRRRTELLVSLASACLGRSLMPRERAALGAALHDAGAVAGIPTVPSVVESLLAPSEEVARSLRTERHVLLEDGRDVALELRRLLHGDLCSMFDGPTTPGLDLSAPLVVLDLSALYSSAALGVLMACATAWLQAALTRTAATDRAASSGRGQFFLVVDEAWAILSKLRIEYTCASSGVLPGQYHSKSPGRLEPACGRLVDRRPHPLRTGGRRRPDGDLAVMSVPGQTVAHSDPGSQLRLKESSTPRCGLLGSMGSIGDCFVNSAVESFFGTPQLELPDEHRWETRKQLALAIFDWIETW
jgi:hypothetical protein